MAYHCNNCGPGCSNYSAHDYEGHGPSGYSALGPDDAGKEMYSDINKYEKGSSQDYHTAKDDKEKKDEEKEEDKHTIEDDIKKEEKKEEEHDNFKAIKEKLPKGLLMQDNKPDIKKKKLSTIEEAINDAIKSQKDITKAD